LLGPDMSLDSNWYYLVPAKLCRADSIPSLQLVFFARLVSLKLVQ